MGSLFLAIHRRAGLVMVFHMGVPRRGARRKSMSNILGRIVGGRHVFSEYRNQTSVPVFAPCEFIIQNWDGKLREKMLEKVDAHSGFLSL